MDGTPLKSRHKHYLQIASMPVGQLVEWYILRFEFFSYHTVVFILNFFPIK